MVDVSRVVTQVAQDVTESARAWFLALVEHSSDLMVVVDRHDAVIYVNPAASAMFGVAAEEVVGASAYEFIHPHDVSRVVDTHAELVERPGSSTTLTLRVVAKDGRVRVVEAVATNCLDIPAVAGIVINGRDVTERDSYLRQLEASLDAVVGAIANALELRDPYTAGHQRHVADIVGVIAQELHVPSDAAKGIEVAAALHDIGKLAIPTEILSRPGQLSPTEFELVKTHVEAGRRIVADIPFPWPVATMILQHHERLDGSGYPNGLTGPDILLGSRILAVADVLSSMSEHRPYRSSLGLNAALVELETNKGRLFDPDVVDACVHLVRAGRLQLRWLEP